MHAPKTNRAIFSWLGLAVLGLAAVGVGMFLACRPEPTVPPSASAATETALAVETPAPSATDPLAPAEPPTRRQFIHPVLAFDERDVGLPVGGTWIGYPLLADFDKDGRADLVTSNREEDGYGAWRSLADGTWERAIAGPPTADGTGDGLPRDMQYGPAAAADADGDGDLDLYVSAHTNALKIFLNDGGMRWTRSTAAIVNPFLLLDIDIGDLDGDAKPDVAGIAHFEGGLSLYHGDGAGGLVRIEASSGVLPLKTFGKDIELADLDGDGIDDLVIACSAGLKAILVRPGEPYRFEDISAGLPVPTIGNTIYSVAVENYVHGDWPQIAAGIVANPQDPPDKQTYFGVWAWSAERRHWFAIDQGVPRNESYRDIEAADFDKDGKLDVLTVSIENGAVIWLGDGSGSFRAKGRLAGDYNKARVAVGDVDGDGWTDIAVAVPAQKENPGAGSVRCYRNEPEIWKAAPAPKK